MIRIIAVRHGETDWNRIRRLQGHTDIPLNPHGVAQAERLAAALADERIVAIHSSDLARALATAAPAAALFGPPVRRDARLRERHYGVLEGRTFPELLASHPDEAAKLASRDPLHGIEGGESQRTFFDRVVGAVRDIAAAEEAALDANDDPAERAAAAVLIVTHGGVLDMLHRAASGASLDAERTWPIPNAQINRLTCDDGRLHVEAWAEEP